MTEFLYPVFGGQPVFGLEATDEAFANYKKGLEYGKKMKDNFFIGCAFDWLTYHTEWKTYGIEDPDEMARLMEEASKYAEEAKNHFSKVCFVSPRGDIAWVEVLGLTKKMWYAERETDLKKKRALIEEMVREAPNIQRHAEESGYPEIIMWLLGGRASLSRDLARLESNSEEKKRLLEDALAYGKKGSEIVDQLEPFLYWNRGARAAQRGNIKSELADLAREPEEKRRLLQEAVTDREEAVEFSIKELTFMDRKSSRTSLRASVGNMQCEYGNMLVRLFDLDGNEELLKKAQDAYQDANESYDKLGLVSRQAESCWRQAQVCDKLGEYFKASQNFDCAASNYISALEKTPPLRSFYGDHASYMQAWSEIEKAKQHHQKQEYGLAEEHFKRASDLHKPLKHWGYLAPNYAAWAQLDHAEQLSRIENTEQALQAFEIAARCFEETRKSLRKELDIIGDPEERQMVTKILKATDLRQRYCTARIEVEEAKILDKKGDHYSSSEKYDSAAEKVEKIAQAVESERDRKEFDLISTISRAWAKMTLAEAEESPNLYEEASSLFEKAKELSPSEKTKTLTLGHSRFCKALQAGVRFGDTGEPALHDMAIQHLENAAQHYVRAGFQGASEYAKATELLLDAYLHINKAKRETEPEKKTKLFAMAEKVLQTSAGSFMKAEHPEKREQVLRLIEKVREERELAMSLNEVLHTPSIVSTTTAFTTPTPNQEGAVGVERFENANIQANILTRQRQLKVGEDLEVEIELVNAGKGPAVLIKVVDVIPSGFELREKPEAYRVEDSYLNMNGKRLNPLKTEYVRLSIRPKAQGEFSLKPTVLYLDENGKYKSHEPEPVKIIVKELGIKGWIKGER
jgi:tetratricopeptide (TPR) repeat protein